MPTLVKQVKQLSHSYVRKGGKTNRNQQIRRLIFVVSWIGEYYPRINQLEQIGKKQIIQFWKNHRDFANSTAYGYWLSIKLLWSFLNRPSVPPKPHTKAINND